jgi:hypothetical protein
MRKLVFPEANGRAPLAVAGVENSRGIAPDTPSGEGVLAPDNGTDQGRTSTA